MRLVFHCSSSQGAFSLPPHFCLMPKSAVWTTIRGRAERETAEVNIYDHPLRKTTFYVLLLCQIYWVGIHLIFSQGLLLQQYIWAHCGSRTAIDVF